MSELKHTNLNDRDFGSRQLNVKHFLEWLDRERLSVRTIPSIADYQFVQIEALLCAIERAAMPVDEDTALADIEANPRLAVDNRASKIVPVWHIAANAHLQWRKLITKAIEDGELIELDAGSKLPVGIVADLFTDDDAQNIHAASESGKIEKEKGQPHLIHKEGDPIPKHPWYTPARYFARQLVRQDSTLLIKRDILAEKVSKSLFEVGIYKRSIQKQKLNGSTVKKAFSNITFN